MLGFQATPFWITKRNGRSVSLSQAGRKVSFGYTQERLKYFTTSRSNCLESRLAKRYVAPVRAHGVRTYEPRQGRKAATAVCFVFAVVTLASSPFPQGLLAAKRSGYAVPVNLNSFFRSALIALACLALGKPTATLAADKPNILIILVDDLGYGDLSSYGAKDLKSPHLDALMADGMRFDSFYANCPVCSPTRAALLSGTYPDIAGVPGVIRTHPQNNWGWLSQDVTLLPNVLKDAGYHTSIIGKWHLGLEEPNTPNGRGFDYFKGFLCDMIDDYYKHRRHGINYFRENRREIDPPGHATVLITEWGID